MAKSRPSIPKEIEREVLTSAGHHCAVCGRSSSLEKAHIVPWRKSKNHTAENLICLCAGCHQRADKERWGEKTLRHYRNNPWILRKREPLQPDQGTRKVTVRLELDYEKFNHHARRLLPLALAGFLEISPDQVAIVEHEPGSVIVTLELPTTAAQRLLDAIESNSDSLAKTLATVSESASAEESASPRTSEAVWRRPRAIGIRELLEAGVHFGHQTKRWNPKMKRFIFEARNGIHIIDLSQTAQQLLDACQYLGDLVRGGGNILFVGTKKQAQEVIKETAESCGQMYVTERWLGGTLTNFKSLKRSLARMKKLEGMFADGSAGRYGKKEQSALGRELERLVRNLDGIRSLDKMPDAMFVVDTKREHAAVAEAHKLGIPVVAIVDTNCDPEFVRYPIAGNDDALSSVRIILAGISEACGKARAEYESRHLSKNELAKPMRVAVPTAAPEVVDALPVPSRP